MTEDSRRKSKRYKVSWPARLLFANRRIVPARVRDVSLGGVGFEYGESIAVDAEVNIELSPMFKGKQYLIRAKGVVTYSMILASGSGFSYGLKFTYISRDQFEDYIKILRVLDQA